MQTDANSSTKSRVCISYADETPALVLMSDGIRGQHRAAPYERRQGVRSNMARHSQAWARDRFVAVEGPLISGADAKRDSFLISTTLDSPVSTGPLGPSLRAHLPGLGQYERKCHLAPSIGAFGLFGSQMVFAARSSCQKGALAAPTGCRSGPHCGGSRRHRCPAKTQVEHDHSLSVKVFSSRTSVEIGPSYLPT